MKWENGYCSSITLEEAQADYEDIHKMMKEYSDQISAIDEKIKTLKDNFTTGTAQRITALEGMQTNLLYAYKGLCSNERAIRSRLERIKSESANIKKIEAGD